MCLIIEWSVIQIVTWIMDKKILYSDPFYISILYQDLNNRVMGLNILLALVLVWVEVVTVEIVRGLDDRASEYRTRKNSLGSVIQRVGIQIPTVFTLIGTLMLILDFHVVIRLSL